MRFYLAWIGFLISSVAWAQVPQVSFKVSNLNKDYKNLNSYLYNWEDINSNTAFDKVISQEFVPYNPSISQTYNNSSYWGKITIESQLNRDSDWVLYVGDYFINESEVYICYAKDTLIKKTGNLVPLSQKELKEQRQANINLFLPAKQKLTIFIKIKNIDNKPLQFNVRLMRPASRMQEITERNWTQGIFQGFMWIMFIYHILIYFYNRDKSYLLYSLYILSNSIYFLNYHFFTVELFIAEQPWLFLFIYISSTSAIPIFYLQFQRAFLDTPKNSPRFDKIMLTWIYIRLAETCVVFYIAIRYFDYKLIHTIQPNFALIEAFLFVLFLFFIFKRDDKQTYFIVIGALCLHLGLGVSIIGSQYLKISGANLIFESGIIMEIFVFALGLGYKLKKDEQQKVIYQTALIDELQKNAQLLEEKQDIQLKANQILEIKVKERTQELEKLSNFKSSLLSIISHDFRSPLASLKGVTSFLSDEDLSSEEKKMIQDSLEQKVDATLEFIDNLLNWSKSQMDGLIVQEEVINLQKIIHENTILFKGIIAPKQITIDTELNTNLLAKADVNMVRCVVRNLLSNAIKFTPIGGKVIIKGRDLGDFIEISIKDNGVGMTLEYQSFILSNKQVMNQTTIGTNNEQGSGLGLLICKDFISKNKGQISLMSELNKGTTFTFTLPSA
jgi:signal transduction histidine kinase